jgi:hypothetical protein
MQASASRIEQAILDLVAARGTAKSICPSEAARTLGGARWRVLMPAVHRAALQLALAGRIDITQRGKRLDPS